VGSWILTGTRGDPNNNQTHSAVNRSWRCICCNSGSEERYDHAADPYEWTSLVDKLVNATIMAELKAELFRLSGRKK
jgi:hypothetical protein